jgi:hypothetical protein
MKGEYMVFRKRGRKERKGLNKKTHALDRTPLLLFFGPS